MQYIITFLEGLISFISPCMLPLLPLYISYFAAGGNKKGKTWVNALCFVLGFSVVFSLLGLFAGTVGSFLGQHQNIVDIVCGIIVIVFGLSYMELFPLPFLKGMKGGRSITGALSAFVFGVIYSVSLTPCVGAFLGSALMMASASGTALKGVLLLLTYSAGLGIPFLLSALLLGQLTGTFNFIKRHYKIINLICGIFLVIVGVMMIFGLMNRLMAFFS